MRKRTAFALAILTGVLILMMSVLFAVLQSPGRVM
jgi:hypothetical protein